MAARVGGKKLCYTESERKALVTAIERRFQAGEGSVASIAKELGTCEASYYNWVKAGVTASKAAVAPYSALERARILGMVSELRASGATAKTAATSVGIAAETLRRWSSREIAVSGPAFRPVEVTEVSFVDANPLDVSVPRPAPVNNLTLVSPGGYRLEGLGVATAAELLRALA